MRYFRYIWLSHPTVHVSSSLVSIGFMAQFVEPLQTSLLIVIQYSSGTRWQIKRKKIYTRLISILKNTIMNYFNSKFKRDKKIKKGSEQEWLLPALKASVCLTLRAELMTLISSLIRQQNLLEYKKIIENENQCIFFFFLTWISFRIILNKD